METALVDGTLLKKSKLTSLYRQLTWEIEDSLDFLLFGRLQEVHKELKPTQTNLPESDLFDVLVSKLDDPGLKSLYVFPLKT